MKKIICILLLLSLLVQCKTKDTVTKVQRIEKDSLVTTSNRSLTLTEEEQTLQIFIVDTIRKNYNFPYYIAAKDSNILTPIIIYKTRKITKIDTIATMTQQHIIKDSIQDTKTDDNNTHNNKFDKNKTILPTVFCIFAIILLIILTKKRNF